MLRPYQLDIRRRVLNSWLKYRSIMVQMPTGTGKTHLLASLVNEELRTKNEKSCVWIVAHRRELVEQIEETVARYGISKEDGRVKVMSIQWLSRHWEDVKDELPGLIVIDEAHHALAETYRELWLRYPEAKKLGMTATPCRMNRNGFTDLFETLIASDSIADFIRQGWLSAFDYVSIRPDSEDQRLVDSLSRRGADGDYQIREMDSVLNRRPGIDRLYESMRQYADDKKGIVYAISIAHARNIAAYYSNKGVNAVAIGSRTPAPLRKRMVEDFRKGRIRVLVNVDVFSEGFDCPDVEFVQMARPTLSLAKYLQQAGRGLRRTEGKETCVLIDNVGLYRLFGLPAAERDWQAMFEGRMAGKGSARTGQGQRTVAMEVHAGEAVSPDSGMEVVVTHDRLMELLELPEAGFVGTAREDGGGLKAFRDRKTGMYGLERDGKITALPQYAAVFNTEDGLAAVRFADGLTGVVDGEGKPVLKTGRDKGLRIMKDRIIRVTDRHGKESFTDLRNMRTYPDRPKVRRFGQVQMLEAGGCLYSRTREAYKIKVWEGNPTLTDCGFYLRISDRLSAPRCRQVDEEDARWGHDTVCLLAGDFETWYSYCGRLPDGSIVIGDSRGRYYHVEEGKAGRYVACENPQTPEEDFGTAVARLKEEAERRMAGKAERELEERERKRQERLDRIRKALPFRAGLKWGLRLGKRVIVPPVYRNIQAPVGLYCAFEDNPHQWGVIMLDGQVVVEARYMNVEIKDNGTACLTLIPGKTETIKLKR